MKTLLQMHKDDQHCVVRTRGTSYELYIGKHKAADIDGNDPARIEALLSFLSGMERSGWQIQHMDWQAEALASVAL